MNEVTTVPLAHILPRGEARITARPDAVALTADPRHWPRSAEAESFPGWSMSHVS